MDHIFARKRDGVLLAQDPLILLLYYI